MSAFDDDTNPVPYSKLKRDLPSPAAPAAAVPSTVLSRKPPPLFAFSSQRLRICLLLMAGLYVAISMRLNLSMAIVCMVNSTAAIDNPHESSNNASAVVVDLLGPAAAATEAKCQRVEEDAAAESSYSGTLAWSKQQQSLLFSAPFYGSLVTITISGVIADKFGPKGILGAAVLVYVAITMASPLLAEFSFYAYFSARVAMGLAEGFLFPCLGSMAGRWFPAHERSTMVAIYTSGSQLAAASSVISAGLCSSPLGWPSIFYLFGALGLAWIVGWYFLASNCPEENAFISQREKAYLTKTIKRKRTAPAVPWKAMLTSPAVHAYLAAQFADYFSVTVMTNFLPTYFRDELALPLSQNGFYSSVPFVAQLFLKNLFSVLADQLKQRKILSPTACSVLFQSLCSVGAASALIALAFLPSCDRPWLAIICLCMYGAMFAASVPGFITASLSIAPQHSGTMWSLGMTAGYAASVVAPWMITGITMLKSPYTWSIVFVTTAVINLLAGTIFFFFGRADTQEWALEEEERPVKPLFSSASHTVHPVDIVFAKSQV